MDFSALDRLPRVPANGNAHDYASYLAQQFKETRTVNTLAQRARKQTDQEEVRYASLVCLAAIRDDGTLDAAYNKAMDVVLTDAFETNIVPGDEYSIEIQVMAESVTLARSLDGSWRVRDAPSLALLVAVRTYVALRYNAADLADVLREQDALLGDLMGSVQGAIPHDQDPQNHQTPQAAQATQGEQALSLAAGEVRPAAE